MTVDRDHPLRIVLNDLLNDHLLSDVLQGLAAEAAVRKRIVTKEAPTKPEKAAAWDRARAMILKAAAVTEDIGL